MRRRKNSNRNLDGGKCERFVTQLLEQDAAQVTLAERGYHYHDQLTCVLFALRDFKRGLNGCTR